MLIKAGMMSLALLAAAAALSAQALPPALGPTDAAWATFYTGLISRHNNKEFCVPDGTPWYAVADKYDGYLKRHTNGFHGEDSFVAGIAHFYPCKASTAHGSVTTPSPYATIDVRPATGTLAALNALHGTGRDALVDQLAQISDRQAPSVLKAMGQNYLMRGRIDDAIFWSQAAFLRAAIDATRCLDPTAGSSVHDMAASFSPEMKQAQKADAARLKAIVGRVLDWDARTGRNYDQRWGCLNSSVVAMGATAGQTAADVFAPADQWPTLTENMRNNYRASMERVVDMILAQPAQVAPSPAGALKSVVIDGVVYTVGG